MRYHPRFVQPRSSLLARFLTIGMFVVLVLPHSRAFPANSRESKDLDKSIEALVRASGAETVAVSYYDLATGAELLIQPDATFHAASTMKVPVMMEIFREVAAGKLSLNQRIAIKNDFASIVDGSHYSLTPDSDSEVSLYTRIGQTETIRELVRLMITVSSNLAANLLIERVTPERVMNLL